MTYDPDARTDAELLEEAEAARRADALRYADGLDIPLTEAQEAEQWAHFAARHGVAI